MSETNYFWQGGRKVEVRQDEAAVTIHAPGETEAREAATAAGVSLRGTEPAAPGLVRADIVGDRDAGVDRLRAGKRVVHHVYRDRHAPDSEYLITESFFLKFKKDTPDQRMRDYFAAEGLVVEQDLGDKTYLVRVTEQTGRNPIRAANAAASRDDVEYAEPNLVRPLTRFFIPADSLFSRQWHLHAPNDATDLLAGAGIFAAEAWDLTRGRRDVVVGVADDGFDLTHPDFQGQGKVVASLNATVQDNGISAGLDWDQDVHPRPGDYHGTPCLGVAVAEGNGTGVVGVAPGCALVAVRFPLSMSDAHFILMFRKVSSLADVISCSWGVPPGNFPMSTTLRDEMATLARTGGRRGKGLIFCIAAGNNNAPVLDLSNTRTYRYRTQFGVRSYSGPIDRWVASHPDAVVVSASTSRKTRSAYSSWGRQICVCAPSDNWDDLAQTSPAGLGITTTDNEGFGSGSDFTPGSRFTGDFGGTSSATPTVAGVCGLVLSANPSLTAQQVKQMLQSTADKQGLSFVSDTPVNEPGEFDDSGFSLWFGHGKVNASRAVRAAAELTAAEAVVDITEEPGLEIPDVGTPVISAIEVDEAGTINDIRVQVDISHTYIGDLRVDLIAPDGTAVTLHNNSGGWADDLARTYSPQSLPALRGLLGKAVRGTWRLSVRDTFLLDVGKLNRWRLVARVHAAVPVPSTHLTDIQAKARPKPAKEWKEARDKHPAPAHAGSSASRARSK